MADRQPTQGNSGEYGGLGPALSRIWRNLDGNQRLAAFASAALVASPLLPWFSQTGIEQGRTLIYPPSSATPRTVSITLTGFQAFTWVEASILLVALAILLMVAARGDERAFHLPGGDGAVIAAGGAWCAFLMLWRVMFDPPSHVGLDNGVEWGLLVAAASAIAVVVAGLRIHSAHRPEPPLPAAEPAPEDIYAVIDDDPTAKQLEIPLGDTPRRRPRRPRRGR